VVKKGSPVMRQCFAEVPLPEADDEHGSEAAAETNASTREDPQSSTQWSAATVGVPSFLLPFVNFLSDKAQNICWL